MSKRIDNPSTTTEEISHTEVIHSTEPVTPSNEPAPTPTDGTTADIPAMQKPSAALAAVEDVDVELGSERLGALLPEGIPTGSSHCRNAPVPTINETDSNVQTPVTIREPGLAPQINEIPIIGAVVHAGCTDSRLSEGGSRALTPPAGSNIVNVLSEVPTDVEMASNLDLNARGEPNPVHATLEQSPDIVGLNISSRNGKRKFSERGVPADDGGSKAASMTIAVEEDSDIEYIGSWSPCKKVRTKNSIRSLVKMGNLPIKLESSDSVSMNHSH